MCIRDSAGLWHGGTWHYARYTGKEKLDDFFGKIMFSLIPAGDDRGRPNTITHPLVYLITNRGSEADAEIAAQLVAIASEISSKRSSLNEKRFREIVRQTTSSVLVSNIFDELRVFLNCLGNRDERLRFLDLLGANILEKSDAVIACEAFNGLEPGTLGHFGEDSSDIFHPFRDLYLAGLLGPRPLS